MILRVRRKFFEITTFPNKGAGEGAAGQEEGVPRGVLLPPGVGLPPLALLEKERGKGKEERGAPPLLVLIGLGEGETRSPYGQPFHLSTKAQ